MNAYDYIDDYKAGLLQGDALENFKAALVSDEKLQKLVDNYDGLKSISEGILEMQLLHEVSAIGEEFQKKKPKIENFHPWFYLGAVAVIAAFVFYYSKFGGFVDTEKEEPVLFADVYQEPIWPVTKSASTQLNDKYYVSKASSKYLFGDFATAKVMLLDSVQDMSLGRYWLAEMYMQKQEFDSVMVYLPNANELTKKAKRITELNQWMEQIN